jgi:phospholipid-binding lipoprotein MlaA
VQVRLGIRSATLLFGVFALLVGGCGTLSGGRTSQSALLASASVSSGNPVVSDQPSVAPPAAVAASTETRAETDAAAESTTAPKEDAPPVALEPGSPSPLEGSAAPVVSQAAPAGPTLAQKRGTAEPLPDVQIEEYDPWEPFNEKMFKFNYNFDKYLFKPVAKGYNFVMPDLFQQMIGHGFDNINVVPKLANNILQWNLKGFGVELGRFLINSTLGIGGLFDIAKQEFGLQKTKVDFGQTLGKWGVGPGPFLILPFMPPLTVRDGIGTAADGAMDPLSYVLPFIWDRLGMKIGDQLNDRSLNLDLFQGFEETTVDLYSAVRNGYLQRRYNMIKGTP